MKHYLGSRRHVYQPRPRFDLTPRTPVKIEFNCDTQEHCKNCPSNWRCQTYNS